MNREEIDFANEDLGLAPVHGEDIEGDDFDAFNEDTFGAEDAWVEDDHEEDKEEQDQPDQVEIIAAQPHALTSVIYTYIKP